METDHEGGGDPRRHAEHGGDEEAAPPPRGHRRGMGLAEALALDLEEEEDGAASPPPEAGACFALRCFAYTL